MKAVVTLYAAIVLASNTPVHAFLSVPTTTHVLEKTMQNRVRNGIFLSGQSSAVSQLSMIGSTEVVGALVADVTAAGVAAVGCAPLVACVDQAITMSANGDQKLFPLIREKVLDVFRNPMEFFTSPVFTWLWFVYWSTYAAASVARTLSAELGVSPILPVLICSTIANMGSSISKDAAFAKMFSNNDNADEKNVPKRSYLMWLLRDVITMLFVFTLPPLLAKSIPDVACRLSAPVVAQYFTTPIHLLGLMIFNLPKAPASKIIPSVKQILLPTIIARQIRILPAFSLGGILNSALLVQLKAILCPGL